MSGADDLLQSVARLSAALDRIADQASRRRDDQPQFHDLPAAIQRDTAVAAVPIGLESVTDIPAEAAVSASAAASATPNADIAARLDHLIEQLRVALSATTG